jgi:hypothetical protein
MDDDSFILTVQPDLFITPVQLSLDIFQETTNYFLREQEYPVAVKTVTDSIQLNSDVL